MKIIITQISFHRTLNFAFVIFHGIIYLIVHAISLSRKSFDDLSWCFDACWVNNPYCTASMCQQPNDYERISSFLYYRYCWCDWDTCLFTFYMLFMAWPPLGFMCESLIVYFTFIMIMCCVCGYLFVHICMRWILMSTLNKHMVICQGMVN